MRPLNTIERQDFESYVAASPDVRRAFDSAFYAARKALEAGKLAGAVSGDDADRLIAALWRYVRDTADSAMLARHEADAADARLLAEICS